MLLLRRGLIVYSKMGILYQKCMALIVISCLGMNCVATDIGVMRFMCVAPAAHFFILGGLYVNIATSPYEILGVRENADIKECTDAYKKLAKKYHPDLNPNDAIAREAMKEINQAYDTIKKSANKSHCDGSQSAASAGKTQSSNNYNTQRSASYRSEKSQSSTSAKSKTTHNSAKSQKPNTGTNIKHETFSIYTYPNYSKNKYRSYTVFSLALFAGCIYLLLEYVIKYCTYENLLNFFTAPFGETDYIAADLTRVTEFLPKINIELYVKILSNLFLSCAIMITAIFLLTAIYNIFYIFAFKRQRRLAAEITATGKMQDTHGTLPIDSYKRLIKIMKTVNITYSLATYITLLICAVAVGMYAVFQSADFFPISFKIYKILMIAIAIIMFVITSFFIFEKRDRIVTDRCIDSGYNMENLNTFIKGLAVSFVPMIVILALIFFIIRIAAIALSAGADSEKDSY